MYQNPEPKPSVALEVSQEDTTFIPYDPAAHLISKGTMIAHVALSYKSNKERSL